ncbi:unnamed protein product [Mesocestoides corti]|uniref:C2H2-type domain-containing protein n=1 Tax=Mesocestoides corti TaxID=53468 RepID=A0A0R3UNS3_MESCO|nr:unnamed protein product [Mesocestoides corti]
MLKKYNIKDKRPRCLFSRPLSDSDDSDWASSGDEWQPESSPVSGLKAFPKRGVSKCPPKNNCQSSKSVAPKEINRLSVDSKTSSRGPLQSVDASGALMELQDEGRNFPKRNIAKLNYKEPPPDPEDDRYLYCYECDKLYEDPCPTHPIMWIRSVRPLNCDAVKSGNARDCCCGSDERNHAKRTAPEAFVTVGRSSIKGAGLGVWAEKTIPIGSVFGPYGGEVVPLDGLSEEEFKRRSRCGYAWLVRENLMGTKSHLIDAVKPVKSNWLRFVNCARHEEEQNLVTIQYRGKIYYRACKFAKELGILSEPVAEAKSPDGLKPYACSECDKSFSRAGSLQRHIAAIHKGKLLVLFAIIVDDSHFLARKFFVFGKRHAIFYCIMVSLCSGLRSVYAL